MGFVKKYLPESLAIIFIVLIFIVSRLYNILDLPIFTDEAIYVRWAQIAKQDANWRFISLTDGKQPMFVWLAMITLRFVEDPLLAGRLVSVGAGFVTMTGMFFLGREIFKDRIIGIISSAMYVIFPMALVYDKLALYDSLVGSFAVWSLFFIVLLVRRVRLDVALLLGMAAGGAVLTKTSGFFSIYLLPISLLLFDWKKKKNLLKWIFLAGISVILTYLFYSVLRLSPFFHIVNEKNAIFVYPMDEWLKHPFYFLIGNGKALWDWTIRYLTWPLLLLSVFSFLISRSYLKEKMLLFLWFVIPIVGLAVFGNTLYPRFIFFMILFLLPLIAYSLVEIQSKIKKRFLFIAFCLFIFSFPLTTDYFILNDFVHARIPRSDMHQYKSDWPAGEGVKKSIEFFENEAKKGKIYIATQGTFGLMPYALEIYLINNPNIKIEGYWPIGDTIPLKVVEESKKIPTYFLFYQPCPSCVYSGAAPTQWNMTPILQIKGGKSNFTSIYRIK